MGAHSNVNPTRPVQGADFSNLDGGDTSLYCFVPGVLAGGGGAAASGSLSSPSGDGPRPSVFGYCSGMAVSPAGTVNVLDPVGFHRYDPNSGTWSREGPGAVLSAL